MSLHSAIRVTFVVVGATTSAWSQTAAPRSDGGLNIVCPSGRTASVVPRGTAVTINIREPDGRTWGMARLPSSGSSDPGNRVGDPASVAKRVCDM